MEKSFDIPILFIIFNRPNTTIRVFNQIKKIKPKKLYVVADGARNNKEGEDSKCNEVRGIINSIDWDCEVFKNYSEINLGCKNRLSSGISWFFENEEMGIILEDDCLPDISFFYFCKELLIKHKDNERIGMISGNNFQFGKIKNEYSYYFSKYSHIWGWATWRRAWKKYDVNMKKWPLLRKKISSVLPNIFDTVYWKIIFDDVYKGKIDTWDYQWTFTCFINNYLSIIPSINLVSNIGFCQKNATHTQRINKFSNMKMSSINFPLSHPKTIEDDKRSDKIIRWQNYPLWKLIIKKILIK